MILYIILYYIILYYIILHYITLNYIILYPPQRNLVIFSRLVYKDHATWWISHAWKMLENCFSSRALLFFVNRIQKKYIFFLHITWSLFPAWYLHQTMHQRYSQHFWLARQLCSISCNVFQNLGRVTSGNFSEASGRVTSGTFSEASGRVTSGNFSDCRS